MKLIQEADNDDQFNKQLMKLQDAVERLMKIAEKIDHPVNSQIFAIGVVERDCQRIADTLREKRKALGHK